MGIYQAAKPCGCLWESTTHAPDVSAWRAYRIHRCVAYGGSARAAAARAARSWTGPADPYAEPLPDTYRFAPINAL